MARIMFLLVLPLTVALGGCYHTTKESSAMEQQQMATCGDPHTAPASQWQGCSRNNDCTQVCGTGWGCYASDGYCHNH